MFNSPQSESELASMRSPEVTKRGNETENKKLTLMLARPLKYYQMGKHAAHIDAGNPALIIPNSGNDGTFKIRKVYPPYSNRFTKQLIPIYNKKGKHIAGVVYDPGLKDYQGDTHNKRTNIYHRVPLETTLAQFSAIVATYISFDKFEGKNVLDSSNNSNDAVLNGAATLLQMNNSCGLACALNGGTISFDGVKFSPKPSTGVTIAFWLKLLSTNTSQSVFSTKGFSHNDAQYHLELFNGGLKWTHMDETEHIVFYCETRDVEIPENEWFHVVGTYDSAERK